jgi:putative ABC transport system permease protein
VNTTSGRGGLVRVLAWRRVADRPVRSCLAAAGVAAGVAFLFSITSINMQVASYVRSSAAPLTGPRMLQVTPATPGGLPDGLVDQLAGDERVAAAAPLLVARSDVSNGSHETGAFVLGLDQAAAALAPDEVDATDLEVSDSATLDRGLAISRGLARRLHVELGGEVTVHASTGSTALPVVAVASSRLIDRLNGGMAAVMPLEQAQQLFGRAGRVDQIVLLAEPDADLDALRDDLVAATDGIGIVGSPGDALTDGSSDFAAVQALTNLVGVFVLLAAVVLVFHTMSMATAERRTEIALARSLGSTRKQLLLVTLSEAGLIGVAGTAVGLVLGGLLARAVVPLARYAYGGGSPVDVPTDVTFQPGAVVIVAVAGVASALLGAAIPARAAARAAPIDAFRPAATYEWRNPSNPSRRLALVAVGTACLIAGIVLLLRGPTGDLSSPTTILPAVFAYLGALILVPMGVPYVARVAGGLLGRLSTPTGRLAADALRANPRRTTINVMALLLPATTVVMSAIAFNSGLDEIGRLAHAVVAAPLNVDADSYVGGPGGSVASQPLAPEHQAVLEAVPGVQAVLPYENANISPADGKAGVIYALPINVAQRAAVPDMVGFSRLADDPAAFTERLAAGEVAVSHFAARRLDLEPGSRLTLSTPVGPREFTVGAVFDDWAFQDTFAIDLDTYRAIWHDDGAHRYAIVPTADASLDELHSLLEAAVTEAGMPAQVHTRDDAVDQLELSTASLLPLVRGMTLASLLFAALALANAAFTTVTERRWTLALQQTLGMTRRQVTRSLALEALTVGLVGALGAAVVGVALGLFTARFLADQLATTLPYTIPWALVAALTALGVAVAVAATSYPRRLAKRLTIIESLRFE